MSHKKVAVGLAIMLGILLAAFGVRAESLADRVNAPHMLDGQDFGTDAESGEKTPPNRGSSEEQMPIPMGDRAPTATGSGC